MKESGKQRPLPGNGKGLIDKSVIQGLRRRVVARPLGEEFGIQICGLGVFLWNICVGKDGLDGTFRHAGIAVDAGVWIDVIPGPFLFRETGHDALDRADFHTGAVADAGINDDTRHNI